MSEEQEKDDVLSNGPGGWPELMVDMRQDGQSLGVVSIREFKNSGEVPIGMLIADAIAYWNELPDNKKIGVTAHVRVVMMSHDR